MLNVCIVKRQQIKLTETFIRAHITDLAADVIHRAPPELRTADGEVVRVPFYQQGERWLRRRLTGAAMAHEVPVGDYAYLLKRAGAEVVLAEYGPSGVYVMEACERVGVPLVVHFHGYDASRRAILDEFDATYRMLFERAQALIVVSRAMRNQLVAWGAPEEKVVVNPCSVDLDVFQQSDPAQAAPVFLNVGRLTEKKAPHLLLLAFAEAYRRCPEARLRMIGDGDLMDVVRDLVAGLGLEDAVDILGAQPHEVVKKEMQHARAYVQHSVVAVSGDSEGTPVSVLEAGASGLPVISTHHAGIPDAVVHGTTGILGPERDVHTMADSIVQLAEDAGLAATMGAAARRHIRAVYNRADRQATLRAVLEAAHHGQPPSRTLLHALDEALARSLTGKHVPTRAAPA